MILLICLIFSLYLLYVNYNNEKIVTDNKRAFDKKIEENINKNSLVIQNISKELENNKFALSEINNNLSTIHKPLPKDDPKIRKPDITKAKEILNWEPQFDLDLGLDLTIEYFKNVVQK